MLIVLDSAFESEYSLSMPLILLNITPTNSSLHAPPEPGKNQSIIYFMSLHSKVISATQNNNKKQTKKSIYLYILLTVIKSDKTSTLDSCRSQIFFKVLISVFLPPNHTSLEYAPYQHQKQKLPFWRYSNLGSRNVLSVNPGRIYYVTVALHA